MRVFTLLFIFCLVSFAATAQQGYQQDVNSGGGVVSNSAIDVSFSIGQPIFDTYQTISGNVYSGFQQGGGNYDILVQTDSVNCFGQNSGSATLFIFGGISNHSILWSNGETDSTANNLIAGTYTVTVTDALGFQVDSVFEIFQPPVFSAQSAYPNSQQEVCNLEQYQFNLSVTGGTAPYSYNWGNTSNMTNPNSPNPIVTSLDTSLAYNPVVTDFHGCIATANYQLIYDDPIFRGRIFYNGSPVGAGDVQVFLFPNNYNIGSLENIDIGNNNYPDSCFTNANGEYTLEGNVFSEKYLILARPRDSANASILPNSAATYYKLIPSSEQFMWQHADSVQAFCGDSINNLNINLLITPVLQGPGILSGFIRWDDNKTQTNNDPIPLIDVVVEKDSIAQGYTVTDSNGYYEFTDLPIDTCYKIYINYCGLQMYGNGNQCLSQNDTAIDQINFWVDTVGGDGTAPGIYTQNPTGIAPNPDLDYDWVSLYPNPAEQAMLLKIKNASQSPASVKIWNLAGEIILNEEAFSKNELYLYPEDFVSGMYFIQIERRGLRYLNKIVFK